MIGNYPISWLISEVMSVILFAACMVHAIGREDGKARLFELLCYLIAAALFEHAGVLLAHRYSYDPHRIMMIGVVPLSILLIEASILYVSMLLFEYFNMPKWCAIWVVGLFAGFQDMSIDPVYVHDRYMFDGRLSGQWNWVRNYPDAFFGIPFFNFSGWLYMTGIYAGMVYLGRWVYAKHKNDVVAIAYPLLCGLFLVVPHFIVGMVLVIADTRTGELVRMIANYSVPLLLLALYWRRMAPIDIARDKIIFTVPIILHLYDIIVGFGLGVRESYIPVTVCAIIHFLFLAVLYQRARNTPMAATDGSRLARYRRSIAPKRKLQRKILALRGRNGI